MANFWKYVLGGGGEYAHLRTDNSSRVVATPEIA